MAKGLATVLGRRVGTIGARTASVAQGYRPLAEAHQPGLPGRARAMGCTLVAAIRSPRRLPPAICAWFWILRRLVLRPMVTQHPDQFAGVLSIRRQQGWPEKGPRTLPRHAEDPRAPGA